MLCYVIWLVGKLVVNFLLVLIELFFRPAALPVEAL